MKKRTGTVSLLLILSLSGCGKTDSELLSDAQDWIWALTTREYLANKAQCLTELTFRQQAILGSGKKTHLSYPCSIYLDITARREFSELILYHRHRTNSVCGQISGTNIAGDALQRKFVVFGKRAVLSPSNPLNNAAHLTTGELDPVQDSYAEFNRLYRQQCQDSR